MTKKFRNHLATHPLLSKGGAHVKSKSSERRKAKQQIRQALADAKHRPGKADSQHFVMSCAA